MIVIDQSYKLASVSYSNGRGELKKISFTLMKA